jgi:hypothetical protein
MMINAPQIKQFVWDFIVCRTENALLQDDFWGQWKSNGGGIRTVSLPQGLRQKFFNLQANWLLLGIPTPQL